MPHNGMYPNTCSCRVLEDAKENVPDQTHLTLLSAISNQKVYRCKQCHSFLAYTEHNAQWEVLLQGSVEDEIKTLYQQPSLQAVAR